jgi:tRNA pseudouridine38-40 synthase
MGMIAEFNYGDLKKIGWNRATRTDKRVHALQNCFSCKIHISKNEEEDEDFRKLLNQELPEDMKVFCIVRPTNRFNAKLNADDREYSYYLPTFMLRNMNEGWYGAGIQRKRVEK